MSDDTEDLSPLRGPVGRAGLQHFHRLDVGGSADVGPGDGHMAYGASSVTPTEL